MGGAGPIIGVHCYFGKRKMLFNIRKSEPFFVCSEEGFSLNLFWTFISIFLSFFLSFFLLLEIIGRSVAVAVATHRDHQHELANSVINILKLESIV